MKLMKENSDSLVLLREFNSEIEAHIIKNKLNAEDIPSFLFNENQNTIGSFLGAGIVPVRLMVRQLDYEKAFQIMESKSTDDFKQN